MQNSEILVRINIAKKSVSGRENYMCKGPEARGNVGGHGTWRVGWQGSKNEASQAGP
jgi:hypothetical protein